MISVEGSYHQPSFSSSSSSHLPTSYHQQYRLVQWSEEIYLHPGDEQAFQAYEEQVVYRLHLVWKQKEGLQAGFPVLEISAKLEDCAYMDTKRHFKLTESTPLYTRDDCLEHFRNNCETLINNLNVKKLAWKKEYTDGLTEPLKLFKKILKDDKSHFIDKKPPAEKKAKAPPKPKAPKAPKNSTASTSSQNLQSPSGGEAPMDIPGDDDEDLMPIGGEEFDFDFSSDPLFDGFL